MGSSLDTHWAIDILRFIREGPGHKIHGCLWNGREYHELPGGL